MIGFNATPHAECINLRERFGDHYRVTHDESYAAERSEFRAAEEPWLQIIPCDHGHIYPHGRDLLAVSTDRRGPIARRIRALPFAEVVQDGDDGVSVTFPVECFDQVAAIIRPKRRRRLSPEHKAKLLASSQAFRFQPGSGASGSGLERAQTGPVDV